MGIQAFAIEEDTLAGLSRQELRTNASAWRKTKQTPRKAAHKAKRKGFDDWAGIGRLVIMVALMAIFVYVGR